jgi:PmbA protein
MSLDAQFCADVIALAKKRGADEADLLAVQATSTSVTMRAGALEHLERAEAMDGGLRVFLGQKQAFVSTSNWRKDIVERMVEQALAMARLVPEDPFCGIAAPEDIITDPPALVMSDAATVTTEQLIDDAKAMEETALAAKNVGPADGADAGASTSHIFFAASNGFARDYQRTSYSRSVTVLAGTGTGMERDYDFSSHSVYDKLLPTTALGQSAAARALARLNPRKMPSGKYPIVFSPRVSNSLVGHFANAINGAAIARGTSFLKDRLGQSVFAKGVTIIDDPLRPLGLRTRPFDAEGLASPPLNLIRQGTLHHYLLDLRAARQLGMTSNGRASRGTGSPPSPCSTNLYMAAGSLSPEELIKDIADGFYVTDLMGMGVNGVTGDYSRGASGFWIKNGEITFPVHEMTIAGNLKEMFMNLSPANDLVFRYGTDAPTLRVEGMTGAGL